MRKFIEEHAWEVLLIVVTMLAVARWWIPDVRSFELVYAASHWALSYDQGLIRRGLVGAVSKAWMPIVSVEYVHHTALLVYSVFVVLLLVVIYALLRYRDEKGRLFRLICLFVAAPATLSLYARDLGRFDLFLIMILLICLLLLYFDKYTWLMPVLMIGGMFIHESFLVLCAPTIIAAIMFVYFRESRSKKLLLVLVLSAISVLASFLVLYRFGNPAMGYEEFSRLVQSRASFRLTDLSMRECYFSIEDHFNLASPYLHDAGSILNFAGALLMLSPLMLILLDLQNHALRHCGEHRWTCRLLFLATLSGLLIVPIATDYGRWLSAVVFCNFFAIFFLVGRGVIKAGELVEYSEGAFPSLFIILFLTYLLFGPFHDWNPFPYQGHVIYSSLSVVSVLLFDVVFVRQLRPLSTRLNPEG